MRHGDNQWFDIVRWTQYAMLDAEELNISSKTLDEAMKSANPEIKRFVGTEGNFGEQLGLTKDWAARIIKLVGSYGGVRTQRRPKLTAEDRTSFEQVVEQRRDTIRTANSLTGRRALPRQARGGSY